MAVFFTGTDNALASHVVSGILGSGGFTADTQWWLGLSTTTPAEDGTNITEPVGNNYSRVQVTGWEVTAASILRNTATISWPNPSASWGLCTYVVCYTASTAGTARWRVLIPGGGVTPTLGQPLSITPTSLEIDWTGA